MTLYKNKYRSESNRLQSWDYRTPGWYFVTLCTQNRKQYFGEIRSGIMGLSDIGCAVWEMWEAIPEHFDYIRLGEFIVMPDHVHAIIEITPKYIEENTITLSSYNDGYYYQRESTGKACLGSNQNTEESTKIDKVRSYHGSEEKEKEAYKNDLAQARHGMDERGKKAYKQDRAQACPGSDQKENDSFKKNEVRSCHGMDERGKKAYKQDRAQACPGTPRLGSKDNTISHGTTRLNSEANSISHGTTRLTSRSSPKSKNIDHPISKLQPKSGSLGLFVNQYKAAVTRWCRKNDHHYFQWQSNYHDHIIRNGFQLDRIAEYIRKNPSAWGEAGI